MSNFDSIWSLIMRSFLARSIRFVILSAFKQSQNSDNTPELRQYLNESGLHVVPGFHTVAGQRHQALLVLPGDGRLDFSDTQKGAFYNLARTHPVIVGYQPGAPYRLDVVSSESNQDTAQIEPLTGLSAYPIADSVERFTNDGQNDVYLFGGYALHWEQMSEHSAEYHAIVASDLSAFSKVMNSVPVEMKPDGEDLLWAERSQVESDESEDENDNNNNPDDEPNLYSLYEVLGCGDPSHNHEDASGDGSEGDDDAYTYTGEPEETPASTSKREYEWVGCGSTTNTSAAKPVKRSNASTQQRDANGKFVANPNSRRSLAARRKAERELAEAGVTVL